MELDLLSKMNYTILAKDGNSSENGFANNTEEHHYDDFLDREQVEQATRIIQIVIPTLFAVIYVVGLIGNGTLIYIVAKNKHMRNVPNILIVSLAAGDFLMIFVSVPYTISIYVLPTWPYGDILCKLNEGLQTLSLGITVFTLTALSVERYVVIAKNPIRIHQRGALKRTVVTATLIWIISLLLSVPEYFIYNVIVEGQNMSACKPYDNLPWPEWVPQFHVIGRFIIYFLAPLLIIFWCYISISRALYLVPVSSSSSGTDLQLATRLSSREYQRQIKNRKKVAKIVLLLVALFIICWLPRHIFVIWYYVDDSAMDAFWFFFKITGFLLMFVSSCVNPLILYFLSKQFRMYYDKYLFCCFNQCFRPRSQSNGGSQTPLMYMYDQGPSKRKKLLTKYSADTRL